MKIDWRNTDDSSEVFLRNQRLVMLLLFLAVLAVYGPSLSHDFLSNWDDNHYVTGNPDIMGFSSEHLRNAFTTFYVGNYAPLQMLSYMLDYCIWGVRPAGFILSNIALHGASGILFFQLLLRLTRDLRLASLSAVIFLFHPVQVESVVWISQRKSVLAMFFFLCSCYFYLARDRKEPGARRLRYLLSLLAFVLALLSKSVVVVLPLVLMLHELCFPSEHPLRKRLLGLAPFFACALVMVLISLKSQQPQFGGGLSGYLGNSKLATFLTMLTVLVRYLGLIFWPTGLSIAYTTPVKTGIDGGVMAGTALVLLSCWALWQLYRRDRSLFFWGALIPVCLLPVSQIVPMVTLMNDRYLYFPLLGAAVLLARGVLWCQDLAATKRRPLLRWLPLLPLLLLPLLCWQRCQVWQDSLSLWGDAVKKSPNFVTYAGMGTALYRAGRVPEAIKMCEESYRLEPACRENLRSLGAMYLETGDPGAVTVLQRLMQEHPESAQGFRLLGLAYLQSGAVQVGEGVLYHAEQLEAGQGEQLSALCHDYQRSGRYSLALICGREALDFGADSARLRYDLARLETFTGRPAEGVRHLEQSVRLGFRDLQALGSDPALAAMRLQPGFQRIQEMCQGMPPLPAPEGAGQRPPANHSAPAWDRK